MPTIIYSGNFANQVAATIAAAYVERQPVLLSWQEYQAGAKMLHGQVFALFSSLRLDLLQELEGNLVADATLIAGFAFERHFMVAPHLSSEGICAACFSKRIMSQPPIPYSAETFYFLGKAGSDFDIDFHAFHAGIVVQAAQLCLLQAQAIFASDNSILFETNSGIIESSKIMPFHGCTCRSHQRQTCAGPERFAAFHQELSSWSN